MILNVVCLVVPDELGPASQKQSPTRDLNTLHCLEFAVAEDSFMMRGFTGDVTPQYSTSVQNGFTEHKVCSS